MIKEKSRYTTSVSNGFMTVALKGEIDHHSAVSVRESIDAEIYAARPKKLIFDLADVEFMDSSGLGLILGRFNAIKAVDGEMVVRNPNKRVLKIFQLAGLGRIVKIEFDERI